MLPFSKFRLNVVKPYHKEPMRSARKSKQTASSAGNTSYQSVFGLTFLSSLMCFIVTRFYGPITEQSKEKPKQSWIVFDVWLNIALQFFNLIKWVGGRDMCLFELSSFPCVFGDRDWISWLKVNGKLGWGRIFSFEIFPIISVNFPKISFVSTVRRRVHDFLSLLPQCGKIF